VLGEDGEAVVVSDHRRRAFLGLTLGNLGQQPWSQVVGPYLTLLVASRTGSAVAVTFALSAHRLVSSLVLPVIGRISDRTSTRHGRRVPLIVLGTIGGAIVVAFMTSTHGYWQLVGVIVVARVCMQVATIGRVGVTPDVFGRSRWAKAVGAIAAVGFLPGLLTLGLIRATWRQDDPSTWSLTFLVAAGGLLFGALAVALLVREAPATEHAAAFAAQGSWRDELRRVRDVPNGIFLISSVALLSVALSGVGRLLPIWARDELHVGGEDFATLSVVMGAVALLLVPLGLYLGSRAHPRTLAISAAVVGAVGTMLCATTSSTTVFVLLTAATLPLTVAAFASLAPQFIPLFPKGDRLGQAFGMVVGPFGLLTSGAALAIAAVVDVVGSTDAMWIIASILLAVLAITNTQLRIPAGTRTDVRGLLRRARHAGLGPGLFDGSVDLEDVLGIGAIEVTEPDLVEPDDYPDATLVSDT
jgi:MFS family permease